MYAIFAAFSFSDGVISVLARLCYAPSAAPVLEKHLPDAAFDLVRDSLLDVNSSRRLLAGVFRVHSPPTPHACSQWKLLSHYAVQARRCANACCIRT